MLRPLLAFALTPLLLMAQEDPAPPVPATTQSPRQVRATGEEKLVVLEMSKVRMYPREYGRWLRTQRKYYHGTLMKLPDHVPIRTEEGVAALDELLEFLETVKPIGPLAWSEGLSQAARHLVFEQGPTGQTGHKGPTGSTVKSRVHLYGEPNETWGEVINYGAEKPRWTVMQLLIDDGVPGRGHRKNIFNPAFKTAGAAIGPHTEYGTMTCVDMADAFKEGPPSNPD